MREDIIERVLSVTDYVISSGDTVRGAAKAFSVSKSTVHKDLTDRLYRINPTKYEQVRRILELNLSERHIRGGEATKTKYKNKPLSR